MKTYYQKLYKTFDDVSKNECLTACQHSTDVKIDGMYLSVSESLSWELKYVTLNGISISKKELDTIIKLKKIPTEIKKRVLKEEKEENREVFFSFK